MLNIKGKTISYKSYKSKNNKNVPTVLFLGGFMSDKESSKATFVFDYCIKNDISVICFDYTGHGESSGDFLDGTISSWLEDSLDVIEQLTTGNLLLIGSSMGGWIALLLALALPSKVIGIIGIAAAPDFTENLVWNKLSKKEQTELMEKGQVKVLGGDNGEYSYNFTKKLITDGKKHLLLHKKIPITHPVILLHGYQDKTVPLETSIKLAELLDTQNVTLLLSKNSNHRMSEKKDLDMLQFAINPFL